MRPLRYAITRLLLLALPALALACDPLGDPDSQKLNARPAAAPSGIAPGQYPIGTNGSDGILLVPASYSASTAAPLVVALHGAGGTAQNSLNLLSAAAESHGFLVLAVKSAGNTWDAIGGRYGPDIARIDRGLAWTFARANVDPARVTLEGFSDGATYALGVGISNGELFRRVVAFSPGFITRNDASDARPEFFVSHGTSDQVLSFANTEGMIVPALRSAGYFVQFVTFDAGHQVPPEVLDQAVTFMLR